MRLPELAGTENNVSVIDTFLGLNKNGIIAESEFSDMKNMTTDYYPLLSPRKKHGVIKTLGGDFNGMANNLQKLVWAEGESLFINSTYAGAVANSKKQFALMGSYLVVFPDKKIFNTETGDISYIEASFTTGTTVTYSLSKADGTVYPANLTWTGDDPPQSSSSEETGGESGGESGGGHGDLVPTGTTNDTEYKYWIDTSIPGSVVMKVWDNSTSSWVSVGTTYVKFEATNIGKKFKEGDGVRFSNVGAIGYNGYNFDTTSVIQSRGDDWVVVVGLTASSGTLNHSITLSRECPDMDFVCEHNNRLWGCSSARHEVYGSKLGDPTNWACYAGISTDSYAATVGTEGKFTGAISYLGQVLFFKDKGVHRLQGTAPSNFQLSYLACRGVQEGSEGSLVILNGYLYYKSRDGFVYFDGSFPRDISQALGTEPYYDAMAGSFRNKYYTCVRDHDYNWYQFIFDTEKDTWVQEGTERVLGYGAMNGAMYYVKENKLMVVNIERIYEVLFPSYPLMAGYGEYDQNSTYTEPESVYEYPGHYPGPYPGLDYSGSGQEEEEEEPDYYSLFPKSDLLPGAPVEGETEEEDFDWYCITGDIGMDNPYNKYIKNLVLRMTIDSGAKMSLEAMYDSSNAWEPLGTYTTTIKRSYTIPIRVKRCDHMKIRFSGKGDVKVYSIVKEIETGSYANA